MVAPRKSKAKKKSTQKPAEQKNATRAVSGKGAAKAISAYIARNPALKEIAAALRRLLKKSVPASTEAVNPWGIPTFELHGPFCFMMVGKDHITLGFARGTSLFDPARLLEGTGKSIRHVKLRALEQVSDPHLGKLLMEAAILNSKSPLTASVRTKQST